MKRILPLLFLSLGCLASSLHAEEKKMTLMECYQQALKYSETVAISAEKIHQAETLFTQALGSVLPKISLEVSEILQDPSERGTEGSSFNNSFTRFSRPEVDLKLTQPLFHGFKEFQAFKLTKANRAQKVFDKMNVERLLLLDVATAFFTIAQIEMDIETTKRIIQASKTQLREIKKRVDLGKNRDAEFSQQDANLSLLEADLEKKLGQRKVAYEMLSFLTGLDPQPPIQVVDPLSEPLKPIGEYLGSLENRPDIQAAKQAVEIAKGNIKIKKGDLYPQADFEANYYPYRAGFQKDIKWDATFSMTAPLFNWETIGKIREAKSVAKQAEYQAEEVRREAVTENKKAYDAFISSRRQYTKYQTATQKAQKSYGLQIQDFHLGMITNVDVLQSQQTWFAALRLRDNAKTDAWLDWFRLQIASGVMP